MQPNEPKQLDETQDESVRVVDLAEYTDLIVSRRRLERVPDKPGWLRDVESEQVFAVRSSSDLRLTQRA
jgi:hypothetical protein